MQTVFTFPSLTGVRTYEQGRQKRIVADLAIVRAATSAHELAGVWKGLEARGFWTKEERAYVAEAVLSAMTELA